MNAKHNELLEIGTVSTDTHSGGQDVDDIGNLQRPFAAPAV